MGGIEDMIGREREKREERNKEGGTERWTGQSDVI